MSAFPADAYTNLHKLRGLAPSDYEWHRECRGLASEFWSKLSERIRLYFHIKNRRFPKAPLWGDSIRSLFSTLRIEIPSPALAGLQGASILDAASRNRFIDRLKTLGELKGIDAVEIYKEGTVIEIRIVKQVQQN